MKAIARIFLVILVLGVTVQTEAREFSKVDVAAMELEIEQLYGGQKWDDLSKLLMENSKSYAYIYCEDVEKELKTARNVETAKWVVPALGGFLTAGFGVATSTITDDTARFSFGLTTAVLGVVTATVSAILYGVEGAEIPTVNFISRCVID